MILYIKRVGVQTDIDWATRVGVFRTQLRRRRILILVAAPQDCARSTLIGAWCEQQTFLELNSQALVSVTMLIAPGQLTGVNCRVKRQSPYLSAY